MGLTESRLADINFQQIKFESEHPCWMTTGYKELSFNQGGPFLNENLLESAGDEIGKYFKSISFEPIILEVCAGNGLASYYLRTNILNHVSCPMISTDLYSYPNNLTYLTSNMSNSEHIVNGDYDSGKAVEKFGDDANTLLLISPPPGMYVDYFAISKWENIPGRRYILYIGELGASDGGEGMYRYMLESKIWKLEVRKMLSIGLDCFGGQVEKELFIFSKMN